MTKQVKCRKIKLLAILLTKVSYNLTISNYTNLYTSKSPALSAVLLRVKMVLACYFSFIVRKKIRAYVSMP